MMRVPGRKFARRLLRPVAKALFPGAIILGYHRVAESDWDPLGLAVTPDNFASQLDLLKQMREIVTVGELAGRRAVGERLERYAALTFDDGYGDFAETVVPIIATQQVPATVFVTTGFIGRNFWWDEVAALLAPHSDNPGQAADTLEVARGDGARPWRFSRLDEAANRAQAARDICNGMACAEPQDIHAVVATLRAWRGASASVPPDCAPLTAMQLETLARQPLVELGAHTTSHGCLAMLPADVQRREIQESKAALESDYGIVVRTFSYPNGSFSETTRDLVKAIGFRSACTSTEAAVNRRTDPYCLPRIWAPDAAGTEFRRWVGNWTTERH